MAMIWREGLEALGNFVYVELLSDENLARPLTTSFCNLDLVDLPDVFVSGMTCSPESCLHGAWSQLMIRRNRMQQKQHQIC